ncbi:MAG TPA: type II toxin-antitoxin system HicB family antitoxin [Pirellulales bacterium]|jgi:predicted RNase H-like HicB family nuclease|nr:type II toxin-antitoxin system HicB family antitoxin [Pirellulales bacterium]
MELGILGMGALALRETKLATRRYGIVVEQNPNNCSAYVPDLPGCVATAGTVDEAEQLLREAIVLYLDGLREDGLPIPEPTSIVEYIEVSG